MALQTTPKTAVALQESLTDESPRKGSTKDVENGAGKI